MSILLRHIFNIRLGTHLWLGLLVVSSCIQIYILEHLFPPLQCYISSTSHTSSPSHMIRTTNYDDARYELFPVLLLLPFCYVQKFSSEFCFVLLPVNVLPCWYERPCSPLALYRRQNISNNKVKAKKNPFLKLFFGRFDSWSFFQQKPLFHTSRAYNMWQQLR